ncbi:hypothetical protein [Streptomyces sp. NPDC059491]|uniref:hypothetical protein n=1 Tax=Streptomyces sp. NPDC059491 TaxID=3346850 RepID=UPI0036919618
MDKTPGPGFFAEVTPLLLESQQLMRRLVAALSHLSTSDYATVPGSRSTLDSLAATVGSAALVSTHLAQAIAVNPLDGLSLLGAPADEVAIRQARETDARDAVEECLAEALHDLDLTATCCSYAASGIARNVGLAQAAMPLPKLNAKQLAALDALARGGGEQRITGGGSVRILAADGRPVHPTTFAFFEKHGLVHVDGRTSIAQGQKVTATERARRLLTPPRPTVPTPPPASAARPAVLAGRPR